jgi:hypothetical protein
MAPSGTTCALLGDVGDTVLFPLNVASLDRIIYSIFQRFNLEWRNRTLRIYRVSPAWRLCRV